MSRTKTFASTFAVLLFAAGCGGSTNSFAPDGVDEDSGVGGGGDGGSTVDPAATGLPCDVLAAIAKCQTCHGTTLSGSAPMPLVTYDDLVKPSAVDASQTYAQRAVARMKDTTSPMPPKPDPAASAADIDALQKWIDGGMAKATCSDPGSIPDAGPSPWDVPAKCTSGRTWTSGDHGSSSMHPGVACINCHKSEWEAPRFAFAGTVYPSAHEPDDCYGGVSGGGAVVVITDKNGKTYNLNVNSAGNFYYELRFGTTAPAMPYKAKIVYKGRERAMTAEQTDGDCNGCHTQKGTKDAPGRLLLP